MASNIILADFSGGGRKTVTAPLWQYDYGQILQFSGIDDLPVSYEVHYSNDMIGGTTVTQIGDEDGVIIPDAFLLTGLPVYAWLYLHTGVDDGETEYQITIPVAKRSRPTNAQPTPVQQDAITQAIAALDAAVVATEAAQTAAETAQGKAEDAQRGAELAETDAEAAATGAGNAALKSEGFAVGTQQDEPVTSGSPYYQNNAKYYAEEAAALEAAAEQEIGTAKDAALGAIGDAKTAAVGDVNAAGATQVGNVNAAGATQTANAKAQAENAEAWANGTRNSFPVSSDDPAYQKSAKYFKEQAENQASLSAGSASAAAADALKAEGFAVGQQNGADVPSGSPYYENSAKYYAGQAEELVGDLAQETTQLTILNETADIAAMLRQIIEDGGSSSNLNGFSLNLGAGNELVITYTNPEDPTDTVTMTAVTDTTGGSIASTLAALAATWRGAIINGNT